MPACVRNSRLPVEPESIVGEVLGRRAAKGVDPAAADFECPYIQSRCPKRSTQLPSEPYPVCSLWKPAPRKSTQGPELIFVCPQRFYAVDFLDRKSTRLNSSHYCASRMPSSD